MNQPLETLETHQMPLLRTGFSNAFTSAAFRCLQHHREADALGATQGISHSEEASLPGKGGLNDGPREKNKMVEEDSCIECVCINIIYIYVRISIYP